MIDNFDLIAERLLSNYDNHTPINVSSEFGSFTIEEAYRLQNLVSEMRKTRGEKIIGTKIGCTSASIRRQLGISHPVYGKLFHTESFTSGAKISASRFCQLAIEGELAVRLKKDLHRGDIHNENINEAVETVFPVIELHNFYLRDVNFSAPELIAHNALHAGFVTPNTIPISPISPEVELSVRIDGKIQDSAKGEIFTQGIFKSLKWLTENLPEETKLLTAGRVILTGSITKLIPVDNPCAILIDAPPYPAVSATITD